MDYKYNIYLNINEKLNKFPMSKEDIDIIKEKKFIYKRINGINKKIDVKDLLIKKCIVI